MKNKSKEELMFDKYFFQFKDVEIIDELAEFSEEEEKADYLLNNY